MEKEMKKAKNIDINGKLLYEGNYVNGERNQ